MHELSIAVAHNRHLVIIVMAAGNGCGHARDDFGVALDRLDRGMRRREDFCIWRYAARRRSMWVSRAVSSSPFR